MLKTNKKHLIFAAALILGGGILIELIVNSASSTDESFSKNTSTDTDVVAVQQSTGMTGSIDHLYQEILEKLKTESAARKDLEDTVLELKLQISKLSNKLQSSNTTPHSVPSTQAQDSTQWFNEEAMANTGLSTPEITQIKGRYESIEMEKLYLRDKAIRENWIGTQRYTDEVSVLDSQFDSFRNNIDDTVYESLLFATGQSNRVVVQDVMQNSPASLAGIKAGDQILQYSNERIYSTSDLRQSITTGEVGEEVKIDLSRDGNKMTVYLPRGPLGIRMESTSVKP